jgi:hypothetical protein
MKCGLTGLQKRGNRRKGDKGVNEQSQPDEGRPIYPIKLTVWAEEDDRKTELIHKLRLLLVEYGANYRLKENCLRESRVYENR